MTCDRSDVVIVTRTPERGPPERDRFEPREDGWVRIDEYWNGCRWVGRGAEYVERLSVEYGTD